MEDYPEQNLEFLETEGIKFFQFGIPGNKASFLRTGVQSKQLIESSSIIGAVHSKYAAILKLFLKDKLIFLSFAVPDDKIVAALAVIMDARNHPMLIHCNKGKVCLSSFCHPATLY